MVSLMGTWLANTQGRQRGAYQWSMAAVRLAAPEVLAAKRRFTSYV